MSHPRWLVLVPLLVACAKTAPPSASATGTRTATVAAELTEEQADAYPAPDGFSWVTCGDGLRCRFLKPDGWHEVSQSGEGTFALFLTEDAFTPPDERFEVGLTINVVRDVERAGVSPVDFMRHQLQGMKSIAVESGPIDESDVMEGIRMGFLSATLGASEEGEERVRLVQQIVANANTGTVYMLIFEAPESRWDAAWTTGEVVMAQVGLSPED